MQLQRCDLTHVFLTSISFVQDDQEDITSFALSWDDEVNLHTFFLSELKQKQCFWLCRSVNCICVSHPSTDAGYSQQSAPAEAVGLEKSGVYSHLEGHTHSSYSQYDF